MASMRHERRINATVQTVWEIVQHPASIAEWFPGIVSCTVDGPHRVITTATGMDIAEEILTIDPVVHRFAYRITSAPFQFHLGTIDVIEITAHDSLCVYSTTAEPDVFALLVSGGTAGALDEIKRQAEATERGRGG